MNESISNIWPRAALDDIPEPKSDAVTITGLVKEHGRIAGYQLPDGDENNNLSSLPTVKK